MPAFAYSSQFREGQWRVFRSFMLQERRDASSRFQVLEAEKNRIGDVRILYQKNTDGSISEKRMGISVSPQGSSLEKLFSAYVSLGGNPFDISLFAAPDKSVVMSDDSSASTMPGGGVLNPSDIRYAYDQGVGDGDTNLVKYQVSRIGGKRISIKEFEVLGIMTRARKWITAEIRQKRTRIEETIIKLCDLREQLDQEVEDLLWATYGDLAGSQSYDPDRYNDNLAAASIAYFFDSTFRVPDSDDPTLVNFDDTAESGKPGSVNINALGGYTNLISDKDEEDNTAF